MIPRSRLATIAHMMLNRADGDAKKASKLIVDDIQSRGGEAREEYINVDGEDQFAAVIPARYTNYNTSNGSVAIVPKMGVSESNPHSGHVGIITPQS